MHRNDNRAAEWKDCNGRVLLRMDLTKPAGEIFTVIPAHISRDELPEFIEALQDALRVSAVDGKDLQHVG